MRYIYPKFSKFELIGLRFGGAGLGNLLFMWSRAVVAAHEHDCELIWPTWPSIKIGPWIRREADKRFYGDLFKAKTYKYKGHRKYSAFATIKKIHCKNYEDVDWGHIPEECIVICDGYNLAPGELQMNFEGIREYKQLISEHIFKNLKKKGEKALSFEAGKSLNIHVRLGDFTNNKEALRQGKNNIRIDINWYCKMVELVRSSAGWSVPVNVFSDGTDEELKDLLQMPDVKRVFFGNSIADIVALSKAPLMIASGSSFSLWARFLGNCSSISFPKQMKDHTLENPQNGFEIEIDYGDNVVSDIVDKIHQMYLI